MYLQMTFWFRFQSHHSRLTNLSISIAELSEFYILTNSGIKTCIKTLEKGKKSGPSCSKLIMSLVNLVKTFIIKYGIYANSFAEKNMSSFCVCKSYSHFFSKNNCELDIVNILIVNILTTNELVKLTML